MIERLTRKYKTGPWNEWSEAMLARAKDGSWFNTERVVTVDREGTVVLVDGSRVLVGIMSPIEWNAVVVPAGPEDVVVTFGAAGDMSEYRVVAWRVFGTIAEPVTVVQVEDYVLAVLRSGKGWVERTGAEWFNSLEDARIAAMRSAAKRAVPEGRVQ
jgi:hypothetical protein